MWNPVSSHTWSAQVCQASDHQHHLSKTPPQELFLAPSLKVEADTRFNWKTNRHGFQLKTCRHIWPASSSLLQRLPCVFNERWEVELHYDYLCWRLTGTSCGWPGGNKAGRDSEGVCTCSAQALQRRKRTNVESYEKQIMFTTFYHVGRCLIFSLWIFLEFKFLSVKTKAGFKALTLWSVASISVSVYKPTVEMWAVLYWATWAPAVTDRDIFPLDNVRRLDFNSPS